MQLQYIGILQKETNRKREFSFQPVKYTNYTYVQKWFSAENISDIYSISSIYAKCTSYERLFAHSRFQEQDGIQIFFLLFFFASVCAARKIVNSHDFTRLYIIKEFSTDSYDLVEYMAVIYSCEFSSQEEKYFCIIIR